MVFTWELLDSLLNLIFTTVQHCDPQFSEEELMTEVEHLARSHTPWVKLHQGLFNSIKAAYSQKPKNRMLWSYCQIIICYIRQAMLYKKKKKSISGAILWPISQAKTMANKDNHAPWCEGVSWAASWVWAPNIIPMAWKKFIRFPVSSNYSQWTIIEVA